MGISFQQVGYQYPSLTTRKWAIQDVTLTIDGSREFVAVIGHTGSGKSTLVQHMNALLLATKGSVTVFGHEAVKGKPLTPIRQQVGMVFQFPEYQLFEETVEKDIMFGPINFGKTKDKAKELARQMIEIVGLDETLLQRSPFSLSGGQMRRVAIAGILAMEPNILILDEPTVGLDPAGQRSMMELFRSLVDNYGKTVIIVTHDMNVVAEYAQRVLVMNKSQLVFDGSPKSLFSDTSLLKECNLDRPNITTIVNDVARQFNVSMTEDVLSMEEAVLLFKENS
jgi:energy-coupling factor transport system ATP-binding protein